MFYITYIDLYAFDGCDKLNYTIKDNVKYLGNKENPYVVCAGATLDGITEIDIHSSTKIIYPRAFYNCNRLSSVTIPNSVCIGDWAFYNCASLTFAAIPANTSKIGAYTFANCSKLTSVTIQDGVTSIGNNAFSGCSGLSSVTIPDSVTSIGYRAFYDCSSLTSVTISNRITIIESSTFYNCSSLTSVTIPNSTISISNSAFYNCINLATVTYCGTEQQWNQIYFGEQNTNLTFATRYYHSWIDASCDSPKTCIYCHITEGDKGHSWIDATCLMPQTCSLCGATEGTTGAHSGEWFEIVTPTCTEDGVEARICDVCKQTETSVLPAGHTYEIIVTAPTCTEQGYTTKTCTRCRESEIYDYITPNGHFWSAWLTTKAATCISEGGELRFCNCGTRETRTVATMPHNAQNSACDICNQLNTDYCQLSQDTQISISLLSDIYIDLNGCILTGTITTNGYKVYGMDSTTDGYTCESVGYFNCVDEFGEAIIPETHFKSEITGTTKRYMAIKDENGYSFHRFYLGITHQTLRPTTTGVGYKAVFYGDEMVIAQLDADNALGFALQLDGNSPVSVYKNREDVVSGKTITLRLDNYDVENHGETELSAKVMLKLFDGTVIESAKCTMTMRSMLETLNDMTLTAEQLTAVKAMIEKYAIIKTWDTENLYA